MGGTSKKLGTSGICLRQEQKKHEQESLLCFMFDWQSITDRKLNTDRQ